MKLKDITRPTIVRPFANNTLASGQQSESLQTREKLNLEGATSLDTTQSNQQGITKAPNQKRQRAQGLRKRLGHVNNYDFQQCNK